MRDCQWLVRTQHPEFDDKIHAISVCFNVCSGFGSAYRCFVGCFENVNFYGMLGVTDPFCVTAPNPISYLNINRISFFCRIQKSGRKIHVFFLWAVVLVRLGFLIGRGMGPGWQQWIRHVCARHSRSQISTSGRPRWLKPGPHALIDWHGKTCFPICSELQPY